MWRPVTKIIPMLDTVAFAVAVLTFGTAALTFGTGIKNARKLDGQHAALSEIRVNVNGRLDALAERVETLVIALTAAGEPVPPDRNGNGGSHPTDDELGEHLA